MTADPLNLLAIAGMSLVTLATRLSGWTASDGAKENPSAAGHSVT